MDTVVQTITLLTILFALVAVALASAVVIRQRASARRRGLPQSFTFPIKPNPTFDLLPTLAGLSIESNRSLLTSTGASRLGDESTMITLAGMELIYHTTQATAIGQAAPVFLTSETSVVPLGYTTLARAYNERGVPVQSGYNNVRWYPASERSLVFAAMLTVTMHSDQAAGGVMVGRFGAELGLALAAAQRKNIQTIAGSDDIVGQAIAYAMADGALIGEDIFASSGYLGNRVIDQGNLVAQDLLRGVLIFAIGVIALVELFGTGVGQLLAPIVNLLGG